VQENVHGIKYLYVSQADITVTETELKEHFSDSMQITNTRENHCYIRLNSNKVRVFQVSDSSIFFDAYVLRQYLGPTHIAYSDITLYTYVACMCGGK
jgi:hypothetical protein